jgi:hypothetical protein
MQKKGLSARDAYQLANIAVDFRVAEAVNLNQVVYGMIPNSVFKQQPPYWCHRYMCAHLSGDTESEICAKLMKNY